VTRRYVTLGLPALVLLLALPGGARAQAEELATARDLEVRASDGTRVRVGEVTGVIELVPSSRATDRFGSVRVRAGLELDARATASSAIPAYVTGDIAGILQVAEASREVRLDALRREARGLRARLVLGDATLEDVPLGATDVRVTGPVPVAHAVSWSDAATALGAGTSRLCAEPGRRCVRMRRRGPLPALEGERRDGWVRIRAEAEGVTLEAWVRVRDVVPSEGALGGSDGQIGAISDGCPYEGRPALVAAGAPVHLRPDGPRWARVPRSPDSVWVHDTQPGTPWVEVTFARGVQRSFPSSTCSTGWVRREHVTWDVLREGVLTLAIESRDDHERVVVRSAPAWLQEGGLRAGDVILARLEREMAYEGTRLDDLRRDLGIGGLFRIERAGAVLEVRVPLAEGCEEPGAGQPAACRPR